MKNNLPELVARWQAEQEAKTGRKPTHNELAVKLEIAPSTLSGYINTRQSHISIPIWRKLAAFFNDVVFTMELETE